MARRIHFLILMGAFFILSTSAFAYPVLQLDIGGGYYVGGADETIVASSQSFTLYALLTPGPEGFDEYDSESFYISAALVPVGDDPLPSGTDLGSFDFAENTYAVIGDMEYGNPPLGAPDKNSDLPSHDVFPAYYIEHTFYFDETQTVGSYDTQYNTGEFDNYSGGTGSYYVAFTVDVSNLSPDSPGDYAIHFDLYSMDGGEVGIFAPFSHDAESSYPVPEPATMLLLGSGIIGLAGLRKRSRMR